MALPVSIAPFEVVVTPVNMKNDNQREAAESLYEGLQTAGVETLLDDRAMRAGAKFKDADLIGVPFRVTVGRNVTNGMVEVTDRKTRTSNDAKIEDTVVLLKNLIWQSAPTASAAS